MSRKTKVPPVSLPATWTHTFPITSLVVPPRLQAPVDTNRAPKVPDESQDESPPSVAPSYLDSHFPNHLACRPSSPPSPCGHQQRPAPTKIFTSGFQPPGDFLFSDSDLSIGST